MDYGRAASHLEFKAHKEKHYLVKIAIRNSLN